MILYYPNIYPNRVVAWRKVLSLPETPVSEKTNRAASRVVRPEAVCSVAFGPVDVGSSDEIIRNADLALYRAKGDGRGTYRFFERHRWCRGL